MKKLILILAILQSYSSFAAVNLAGNHAGKSVSDSSRKIDLMIQAIPGREGSYFGLMISKSDHQVALYRIDPSNSYNMYMMTPATRKQTDMQVGITENPTLLLTVTEEKKGHTYFTINTAGNPIKFGFDGAYEFDGDVKPRYEWITFKEGTYKFDCSDKESIKIGTLDPEGTTTISSTLHGDLGSNLSLEKLYPNTYILRPVTVSFTETTKQNAPSKLAFFVKKKGVFSDDTIFIMVSVDDSTNAVALVRD